MIVDTRPLIVQQVVRCDHLRYDEDDRPQCLKQTMLYAQVGSNVQRLLEGIGWGMMGNSHYCPDHCNW